MAFGQFTPLGFSDNSGRNFQHNQSRGFQNLLVTECGRGFLDKHRLIVSTADSSIKDGRRYLVVEVPTKNNEGEHISFAEAFQEIEEGMHLPSADVCSAWHFVGPDNRRRTTVHLVLGRDGLTGDVITVNGDHTGPHVLRLFYGDA